MIFITRKHNDKKNNIRNSTMLCRGCAISSGEIHRETSKKLVEINLYLTQQVKY